MAKLILKRKNYSRGYFHEIRRLQSILTVCSMLEPVLWVIFGLDTIFNVISRLEPVLQYIFRLDTIFIVILRLEPVLQDILKLDPIFNVILGLEAFRMCFQHLKLPDFLKFDKVAKNNVFFLVTKPPVRFPKPPVTQKC